jgi:hypothetical protein
MKSRRFRRAAGCAAALFAGTLALASPASAADVETCTTYGCRGSWGAGSGYWQQDGDVMLVCDNYADGWSVVVVATFDGVNKKYKWRTAGAGCSPRSYGNLDEGTGFSFMTCLGRGADNSVAWETCGPPKSAKA